MTIPDWFRIADAADIGPESGATFFVDDVEVAVFQSGGDWLAIEGRCPHKGASLGNGCVQDGVVTCPWHDWKFDLRNGNAIDRAAAVATIPVRFNEGELQVDRSVLSKPGQTASQQDDGVHRYVVRYGSLGWVGLFGTVDRVECTHRDQVVVQTHRGMELGEVLADPTDARSAYSDAQPTGEVVRVVTAEELRSHTTRQNGLVDRLIGDSQTLLDRDDLPISVVDGEVLFDGESAVLYFLGESHPDAGPLVTGVARDHGLERIELQPMIDPPAPASGCGKPGCGGGGCHS